MNSKIEITEEDKIIKYDGRVLYVNCAANSNKEEICAKRMEHLLSLNAKERVLFVSNHNIPKDLMRNKYFKNEEGIDFFSVKGLIWRVITSQKKYGFYDTESIENDSTDDIDAHHYKGKNFYQIILGEYLLENFDEADLYINQNEYRNFIIDELFKRNKLTVIEIEIFRREVDFIDRNCLDMLNPKDVEKYITMDRIEKDLDERERRIVKDVYILYKEKLEKDGRMDEGRLFKELDDYLDNLVKKMLKDKIAHFDHLVLYETECISKRDFNLLRKIIKLINPKCTITIFYDNSQCIYPNSLLAQHEWFKKDAPVMRLKECYFHAKEIMEFSQELFRLHNPYNQKIDGLKSQPEMTYSYEIGIKPMITTITSKEDEKINFVNNLIGKLTKKYDPREIAIVCYKNNVKYCEEFLRGKTNFNFVNVLKLDSMQLKEEPAVNLTNISKLQGMKYKVIVVIGCEISNFSEETEVQRLFSMATKAEEFLGLVGEKSLNSVISKINPKFYNDYNIFSEIFDESLEEYETSSELLESENYYNNDDNDNYDDCDNYDDNEVSYVSRRYSDDEYFWSEYLGVDIENSQDAMDDYFA